MVIEVRQTKANIKQEFEIYYNGRLQYSGKQSTLSALLSIYLYKLDGSIQFQSKSRKGNVLYSKLMWGLPIVAALYIWIAFDSFMLKIPTTILLFFLFDLIPIVSKACDILNGTTEVTAYFCHIKKGLLTGYYSIKRIDRNYHLYLMDRSHFQYISVYLGDKQIAQINKNLHTVNNRDNYTLYLLDEEIAMADLLTMFILYFDNCEYASRGDISIGTQKNWSWSFSRTNRFYNNAWLSANFDDSNLID
jgi:hypothetical protein